MSTATTSSSTEVRPFGIRDKVGYLFGDFGNDFMFIFASSFLMVFYVKIMGISGAVVGTLFLIARIIDAFADVTVGVVVDRASTHPAGKYRVVMMRMAAPAVIFSFLMYQTFAINSSMGVKIAYMYVTYIIWGILYSCVNIPYGSMASVISPEPEHRTSLSTFRTMGASCASLIVGVATPIIIFQTDAAGHQVIRGGDGTQIFMWIALAFSVCSFACYFICYKLTTERVKVSDHRQANAAAERASTVKMITDALSSRAMIGLILSAVALLMAMLFLQQMANYLYTDYFGNAALLSTANLLAALTTFALAPFIQPLSRRFGHKGVGSTGAAIGSIGLFTLFALHTHNPVLFMVLYVLTFMGIGMFNLVVFAMVTDVIDDIEVSKGVRQDAICYSVYSFSRKLGQAFAGLFAGASLTWIGYQAGATAVQSESILDGLYAYSTLLPAIFFTLMFAAMTFVYPLEKKRVTRNAAVLRAKREAAAATEAAENR